MKVLWISNTPLDAYMKAIHNVSNTRGGWLDGLYSALRLSDPRNELSVGLCSLDKECHDIEVKNTKYYSFTKNDKTRLEEVIRGFEPDIVHIFGTEYRHTLAATDILIDLGIPFVTSIQGLISVCARHYSFGLPRFLLPTLRDTVRLDTIKQQAKKFEIRGKYEIKALLETVNVIGRTDWDYACTKLINPDIKYFKCNEVLRSEFYEGAKWSPDKCEKHSIFISQINYPIKGFHTFIEALRYLKKNYPNMMVYVTGKDIVSPCGYKNVIVQTSYSRYIRKLLLKNKLGDSIVFLGSLNAAEMKERYLKSHVSVSCSVLENSSNSIAEAGILGVPVVSTLVGGGSDMVIHGETGFLYNILEPYMAYHYIDSIFKSDEQAKRLSKNSIKFYEDKCSPKTNGSQLIDIYKKCVESGSV